MRSSGFAELFRDRKAETDKIGTLIRELVAPDLNFLQCLEQANNLPVIFDGEAAAAAKQHFANLEAHRWAPKVETPSKVRCAK